MFKHFAMHMEDRGCGPRGFGRRDRHEGREAHFAGPRGFGPGEGRGSGRGSGREEGFGHGGGRERMFDSGAVRLVLLHLLAQEPGYGYQLIKRLEERMAGGYTPSAGVVYPTLNMLEEQGLIAPSTNEAGKKVFTVTDEGHAFLEENKARVEEIEARMQSAGRGFERGRSPEIMQAFMNLRGAVMARVVRGNTPPERIAKIAEAINAAAKAIDEL